MNRKDAEKVLVATLVSLDNNAEPSLADGLTDPKTVHKFLFAHTSHWRVGSNYTDYIGAGYCVRIKGFL